MPLWKWAAIVETWALRAVDDDDRASLESDLNREVDFTWMSDTRGIGDVTKSDPVRWQKNVKGESLLSKHRKQTEG